MKLSLLAPWIIIIVVLNGCESSKLKKEKKLPELSVMPLRTHNIAIPHGYISEISAVQYVEIHARVQGYLENIYVDEGKEVSKGDPLFRLSSSDYKEMVTKAQANLQRAVAEAKTKQLEVDRIKLMVDKNVISRTELEVAMAHRDAAQSGIREAESVLQNAKIHLNYTDIRAPFDGIVDRIPFKIGSLINPGTLLTSVSKIDEVFAYFRVSEKEYLHFKRNGFSGKRENKSSRVSLILADGAAYNHMGYIETMEGDFDRETGSIAFRARFPNPEKILKHGSSGKVVMSRELKDAVLVPQESTFTIQDKNYVFVLDKKNVARTKSFQPVEQYENYFVTTGLSRGDVIVLEGIQQIRDGVPITPKQAPDTIKFVSNNAHLLN